MSDVVQPLSECKMQKRLDNSLAIAFLGFDVVKANPLNCRIDNLRPAIRTHVVTAATGCPNGETVSVDVFNAENAPLAISGAPYSTPAG